MGETEQPFVQIPLPPPEWEEYVRRAQEQEQQEKESLIVLSIQSIRHVYGPRKLQKTLRT